MHFIANIGEFHTQTPDGPFSFHPEGDVKVFGPRTNPEDFASRLNWSARFFVGFNVGKKKKWNLDDVVEAFKKARTEQIGSIGSGASFLSQRGIWREESGVVTDERSCQLILLNLAGPLKTLRPEMVHLAEKIGAALQQKQIIMEIQRNGITQITIGVRPE